MSFASGLQWKKLCRGRNQEKYDNGMRIETPAHKLVNAHRHKNFLTKVQVKGEWLFKEAYIKEGVIKAFESLLSEAGNWRSNISGMNFEAVGSKDCRSLEIPFTEEEAFATLSHLRGDKVPRNGSATMFWQFCWNLIKHEVMGIGYCHISWDFLITAHQIIPVALPLVS